MKLTECVWLDLDGTIADNEHRMPLYHEKEWLAFYAETVNDKLIIPVAKVIECLATMYPIMVCTARPQHNFVETYDWLRKYEVPFTQIYMRPDKDHRPDTWVKYDMLGRLKRDGYWPLVAFDDRNRIVKMLRDNNIKVLHVEDGDY